SHAERETKEVAHALKQEKKKELQDAIDSFLVHREAFATELAAKFSINVEKARELLNRAFGVKKMQSENMWNALVSRCGKELNEDCSEGNRYSLAEIQTIVREEKENGLHDDVDQEKLCKELKDSREVKSKGARSSNLAASVDYNGTARRITTE
ncbi:hypothetical protein C0991_011862, partial [Blastosporella zonata]